MKTKKILASAALLPWVGAIVFILGPVRWEVACTYEHLIRETGYVLPLLTLRLTLPILGIGPASFGARAVSVLFFGFVWLGLAGLYLFIWRARSREDLLDRFVFGSTLYFGSVIFVFAVAALGLALPFLFL